VKKTVVIAAILAGLLLGACGESGPTDEEKKAAADARTKATKLARQAESAAALATGCQQDLGGLIKALRNTGSRLDVGLTFADYSTQVGQISVAYDRIPFKQMDFECISPAGVKAEKAFGSYTDAYNQWNDCISDLYCDTDSIESDLQGNWSKADSQTRQARSALFELETEAVQAQAQANQQKKKADEAEAALET
jgi:hypothetical protein